MVLLLCNKLIYRGALMIENEDKDSAEETEGRRDFINIAAASFVGVGVVGMAWPFINQMNPSSSVLALSTVEVDLSGINVGQTVRVSWRGKPVFIRHRTEQEIAHAIDDDAKSMPDPQLDSERVKKSEWLVMIGSCTHLGCIPVDSEGDYGGWYCPCHGSHYDISGRIRKGPAPTNLVIPKYDFIDSNTLLIG